MLKLIFSGPNLHLIPYRVLMLAGNKAEKLTIQAPKIEQPCLLCEPCSLKTVMNLSETQTLHLLRDSNNNTDLTVMH